MAERRSHRTWISAAIVWAVATWQLDRKNVPGEVWAWLSFGLWAATFAKWAIDKLLWFRWGFQTQQGPAPGTGFLPPSPQPPEPALQPPGG